VLGQKLWNDFPAGVNVAFYRTNLNLAAIKGKEWAARERAIATVSTRRPISAANLAFGRAFPDSYSIKTTLLKLAKVLTRATEKAGKPQGISASPGSGPARIRMLAFFSHGAPDEVSIGDSRITTRNAKSIIKSIAPALTTGVRIILYACNAARGEFEEKDWYKGSFESGGEESIGAMIRDILVEQGAEQATVWGHTTMGHMTTDYALRIFYAAHGKGAPGLAYAREYPFGMIEEVLALYELDKEISDRRYYIPNSKVRQFWKRAYYYLSGRNMYSLIYRCYREANQNLRYKGAYLAEVAPTDPRGVSRVIQDYWINEFWPKHMPELATTLINELELVTTSESQATDSGSDVGRPSLLITSPPWVNVIGP
jgi:hypothetical protein